MYICCMILSKSKLDKILKKYSRLHKKHKASWNAANDRINKSGGDEHVYRHESFEYQSKGSDLFDAMIAEFDKYEVFPKTK